MVMYDEGYEYTIIHIPLAFVRSGYVGLDVGRSHDDGYGYFWPRVSRSTTHVYVLTMSSINVGPSSVDSRWYGFPLSRLYGLILFRHFQLKQFYPQIRLISFILCDP